jgi:hypothetical protein
MSLWGGLQSVWQWLAQFSTPLRRTPAGAAAEAGAKAKLQAEIQVNPHQPFRSEPVLCCCHALFTTHRVARPCPSVAGGSDALSARGSGVYPSGAAWTV